MRRYAAILLLPIAAPVAALIAAPIAAAESTLVTNAVLISGEDPEPLADAWVRFEDGKIRAVGSGPVDPEGALVIDAGGRYLVPGLIDSHVHLYHATGLKSAYTDDYERLYRDYMQQQPRSFLYHGFTTVVELNADFDNNARFLAAGIRPDLVHCGQGVILDDGFMALEVGAGRLADAYPGYLVDHYAKDRPPTDAEAAHTPAAAVRHVRSRGGRCIKMYYEEALWWPGGAPDFALPTVAIVRDVVAAAHAAGMPVLLHATTPAGHRFGLEAGVDVLAHGMWEWPGQAFDAALPSPEYRQIADDVAASGTWVQPTLSTIRNTASLFQPALLDDPGWRHAVPAAYLDYLRGDAQIQRDLFVERFGSSFPPETTVDDLPALQRAFLARYRALIADMVGKGARLAFATDTAVGGFGWAAPPGLAGYWEMRALAEAGIPLDELFEALTVNNARAMRLDTDRGTIEPGKRADLLLLDASPLESVSAYDAIRLVIIGGRVVDRRLLSATTR